MITEFASFIVKRKLYWLIPFIISISILVALAFLTNSSAIIPFIYTIF